MWESLSLLLGIWLLFLLIAIYYLSQSSDGSVGRWRDSVSEHLSAESRAKTLLDWQPRVQLQQGLEATAAWFADEQRSARKPVPVKRSVARRNLVVEVAAE